MELLLSFERLWPIGIRGAQIRAPLNQIEVFQIGTSNIIEILYRGMQLGVPRLVPHDAERHQYQFVVAECQRCYFKDYRNIDSLKAAFTAAFQETPREMINSILYSVEKRLKMVIECQGHHIKK